MIRFDRQRRNFGQRRSFGQRRNFGTRPAPERTIDRQNHDHRILATSRNNRIDCCDAGLWSGLTSRYRFAPCIAASSFRSGTRQRLVNLISRFCDRPAFVTTEPELSPNGTYFSQCNPPGGGSSWTFVASSQWPVVDEATSPEVFRGAGLVASSTTAIRPTTPTKNREVPPEAGWQASWKSKVSAIGLSPKRLMFEFKIAFDQRSLDDNGYSQSQNS